MLIDNHCHINMMIKKKFDVPLTPQEIVSAHHIIKQAEEHHVTRIINIGTSLIESQNCVTLSKEYNHVFAAVGIHPNDCSENWQADLRQIKKIISDTNANKIVGIGECGIDLHYPNYNLQRQIDAFKAHIELALAYNLALIVHSRDAADETLTIIDAYKNDIQRGIMHCFSYDQSIADDALAMGFALGIGGPITYPKNNMLRSIVQNTPLEQIILETDAPFLPPQIIRGKQNHPKYIKTVAEFMAKLRNTTFQIIAQQTTKNACELFGLNK